MELFKKIESSGDLYPSFDYAYRYGIPQADKVLGGSEYQKEDTFDLEIDNENAKITIKEKYFQPQSYFDSLGTEQNHYRDQYLYYHLENKEGFLSYYATILMNEKNEIEIPIKNLKKYKAVRFHYRRYTEEILIDNL